jgi:DNA-binding protein HU-beta
MNGKKPLTKSQILQQLSETTSKNKKDVLLFLDSLCELAYGETKKSARFTIPGIGILKLQKRKARLARNPATGAQVKVPAKTVVKFTVSKACKDAIVPPKKK